MKSFFLAALVGLATVSFGDYDFLMTGQNQFGYYVDGYGEAGQGGSLGPVPTGGNPGACYSMNFQWSAGDYDIRFGFDNTWTVDPSANDWISSIDFDSDYRKHVADRTPTIYVTQGSQVFSITVAGTGAQNTWLHSSATLSANDFSELLPSVNGNDPNSHPNFGPTGDLLEFYVGFRFIDPTNTSSGSESFETDNMHIHAHTVPEPGSLIAILGGVAILSTRRRKTR